MDRSASPRTTAGLAYGILFALLGLLIFLTPLAVRHTPPVRAQTPQSPTTSRYIGPLNGNPTDDYNELFNDGCNQSSVGETGVIILDFFAQWTMNGANGMMFPNGTFIPDSEVLNAAKGNATGFYACAPSSAPFATIAIGTNNNGGTVSSARGSDWVTSVINPFYAFVHNQGFSALEDAAGANDIEPSYSSATNAVAWGQGYSDAFPSAPYFDYGSADGCPTAGTQYGADTACANSWHQSDVWNVSWGLPAALAVPEIYATTGDNARQWQQISLYGYYNRNGDKIYFSGEMSQRGACDQVDSCQGTDLAPGDAWLWLYRAVNCFGASLCFTAQSDIAWSTDIRWDHP